MPANAQELLTKVNGGTSWQLPEINGNTSFASNNFKASTANSYLMGTDDYLLFVNSSDASASIELPDPTKCQGRKDVSIYQNNFFQFIDFFKLFYKSQSKQF